MVGIRIVAIWILHILSGLALILRVSRLLENPRKTPKASLNCHVARRLPRRWLGDTAIQRWLALLLKSD